MSRLNGEGAHQEVLETIRYQQPRPEDLPVSVEMPHSSVGSNGSAAAAVSEAHPSWWIQDFLHTTLGIARRNKNRSSPDSASDSGSHKTTQTHQDPDPASTSGQIQLWQVNYKKFHRTYLK